MKRLLRHGQAAMPERQAGWAGMRADLHLAGGVWEPLGQRDALPRLLDGEAPDLAASEAEHDVGHLRLVGRLEDHPSRVPCPLTPRFSLSARFPSE